MSCKSKKMVFDPENVKTEYLYFGTGGGFTGKVKSFYLTSDGKLITKSDTSYQVLGEVSEDLAAQMFQNYTTLGIDKMKMNEPGNKYQFIERHVNGDVNMVKWGKNSIEGTTLDTYFHIMMGLVKKMVKPTNNEE